MLCVFVVCGRSRHSNQFPAVFVADHLITKPRLSVLLKNVSVANNAINYGSEMKRRVPSLPLGIPLEDGISSRPQRIRPILNDIAGTNDGYERKPIIPNNHHASGFLCYPCRAVPVVCTVHLRAHYSDGQFRSSIFSRFSIAHKGLGAAAQFDHDPSAFNVLTSPSLFVDSSDCKIQNYRLNNPNNYKTPSESEIGFLYILIWILCSVVRFGSGILSFDNHRYLGITLFVTGSFGYLSGGTTWFFCDPLFWRAFSSQNPYRCDCEKEHDSNHCGKIVQRKPLTSSGFVIQ